MLGGQCSVALQLTNPFRGLKEEAATSLTSNTVSNLKDHI